MKKLKYLFLLILVATVGMGTYWHFHSPLYHLRFIKQYMAEQGADQLTILQNGVVMYRIDYTGWHTQYDVISVAARQGNNIWSGFDGGLGDEKARLRSDGLIDFANYIQKPRLDFDRSDLRPKGGGLYGGLHQAEYERSLAAVCQFLKSPNRLQSWHTKISRQLVEQAENTSSGQFQ